MNGEDVLSLTVAILATAGAIMVALLAGVRWTVEAIERQRIDRLIRKYAR